MAVIPHISLLPIDTSWSRQEIGEHNSAQLPLQLVESVFIEDVTDIMQQASFIWKRYISEQELESLKHVRYAIVHHFEVRSEDLHRRPEDEKAKNLLYKLYLGLKTIRPTRSRFQVFIFNLDDAVPRTPRWERNDHNTILCDYEDGRLIQWTDIREMVSSASAILQALGEPTSPISQAIQSLEIGYRSDWLNVRHLLWVVGLDALFTSNEWQNRSAEVSIDRICNFLGSRFRIYAEQETAEYGVSPLPVTTLCEVLEDIYRLRNHFAHGTWPDKHWAGKSCRRSADFSRDISHAEVLSEAASVCLRGCLRKIFGESQLINLFREKNKMNAHFSSKGLARKKKQKAEV